MPPTVMIHRAGRRRRRPSRALVVLGILVAACDLVAACGPATSTVAPPGSPTIAPPSASGTGAVPSAPDPVATPSPLAPGALLEPPPVVLVAADGASAEGSLGTFSWRDAVNDAPWLPGGGPLAAAPGSRLEARTAGGPVGSWRAIHARYEGNGQAGPPALLGEGDGLPITFDAPPPGAWSIQLEVEYPGLGRATWYWAVEVPG